MRNLFRFLLRNYFFLMFLLLEIISMILIVSNNNFQRVKFINSSNSIAGSFYSSYNSVSDYFSLRKENEKLARENAMLRNQLQRYQMAGAIAVQGTDSIGGQLFEYMSAKVISNSVNRQFNYITLDKGSIHGIKPDMGIICPDGVVGVITNVSPYFSTALSLLNKRLSIPAKIKNSNFFGSLVWDGKSATSAELNDIPFHVQLAEGDTVVTSGFSTVFPEGIQIGTIKEFNTASGSNFYHIAVQLTTEFRSLNYVQIITNKRRQEQKQLESYNTYD